MTIDERSNAIDMCDKFRVRADGVITEFSDYTEASRFYCQNAAKASCIELEGQAGIVGFMFAYNYSKAMA